MYTENELIALSIIGAQLAMQHHGEAGNAKGWGCVLGSNELSQGLPTATGKVFVAGREYWLHQSSEACLEIMLRILWTMGNKAVVPLWYAPGGAYCWLEPGKSIKVLPEQVGGDRKLAFCVCVLLTLKACYPPRREFLKAVIAAALPSNDVSTKKAISNDLRSSQSHPSCLSKSGHTGQDGIQ